MIGDAITIFLCSKEEEKEEEEEECEVESIVNLMIDNVSNFFLVYVIRWVFKFVACKNKYREQTTTPRENDFGTTI